MVNVVNPETGQERQVSATEYRRLQREVAEERRGNVMIAAGETPPASAMPTRLWDYVDSAWTLPFPTYQAQQMTLRTVVKKCSACAFTTAFDGGVEAHVQQVRADYQRHKEARTEAQTCTGCGVTLKSRPQQAERHLARAKLLGEGHLGAVDEVTMLRYGLGPSAPTVLSQRRVAEGEGARGPVTSQVERSAAPKRRRRRSRNRRGSRGANAQ